MPLPDFVKDWPDFIEDLHVGKFEKKGERDSPFFDPSQPQLFTMPDPICWHVRAWAAGCWNAPGPIWRRVIP
jgi:hypothetical protein